MNMKAKIVEIGNFLIIVYCLELYIGTCFCIIQDYTSNINDIVMTAAQNMFHTLLKRLSVLRKLEGGLYCVIYKLNIDSLPLGFHLSFSLFDIFIIL